MCKNNDEEVLILNILCVRWGGVLYTHTLILRNMLHIKLTFVNDKSHTCTMKTVK